VICPDLELCSGDESTDGATEAAANFERAAVAAQAEVWARKLRRFMTGGLRRMVFMCGAQRICGGKVWDRKNSVFGGILAKSGVKTWCFDGEFVVRCVVNVVLLTARFGS
jgi:hypothetical protein